jgi:hypothetical protein
MKKWSHPPGLNRRPTDYEESSPAPKVQALHTEMPGINNLGNLLSPERQLPELKTDGVLTQFWHGWHGLRPGTLTVGPDDFPAFAEPPVR